MRTIIASLVFVGSVAGVYFLFPNLITFKSAKAAVELPDWKKNYEEKCNEMVEKDKEYSATERLTCRIIDRLTVDLNKANSDLKKEKEESERLNKVAVESKAIETRLRDELKKSTELNQSIKNLLNGLPLTGPNGGPLE